MSEERACSGFGRHSTGSGWEEPEDSGRLTSLPIPKVARGPIPKGVKKPRSRKQKKVVKRGRPVKWVPAILSEEHVDHANRVLHEYGIDDSQRQRVLLNWHVFLAMNDLASTGEALLKWVGQAECAGLLPGSVHTYATHIRTAIPHGDNLVKRVMKAVMRKHADHETSQALFVPFEELVIIIEGIEDRVLRTMCYVMLVAGLRPNGARWLRHTQMAAEPVDDQAILLDVQVRVDKNAWKRVHRDQLSLRRDFTPLLAGFPSDVRKCINGRAANQQQRPFWSITNTAINNALRSVSESLGTQRATSTSFRKSYMQRTFDRCSGDMDEVRKWTLHHSKFVTKAHYFQWRNIGYADPEAQSSSDESEGNSD